jgi:molybdopterin molybdotransferase
MPPGTDAVLKLHLADVGPAALAAIPPGSGVQPGMQPGLPSGTSLRPPHLAQLARLGHHSIPVVRRPRVALHVAGPKSGPDALTAMLEALVAAAGGRSADATPDLHIHAGRSGPGPDDDGGARLESVHAHGIAIRPGETAAIGTVASAPAILLPGDPLACATSFALLAAPALRRMGGRAEPVPRAATLTRKIASGLGQLDAVRVRVEDGRATPLGPADSALLGEGAGADGLVLVPEGSEGYPAGAIVLIYPLP